MRDRAGLKNPPTSAGPPGSSPAGQDLLLGWMQPSPGVDSVVWRLSSSVSRTNSTEKVTHTKSGSVFGHWHEKKTHRGARSAGSQTTSPSYQTLPACARLRAGALGPTQTCCHMTCLSLPRARGAGRGWSTRVRAWMRVCAWVSGCGVKAFLRFRFGNFIREFHNFNPY